jgi:amidohydrolase
MADETSSLRELRRALHAAPELSDHESATASSIAEFLQRQEPDELVTGLGGHGVAAVFRGASPGPCVLLRSELDALPIEETAELPYASRTAGVSHKCGHDGHMAMVAGVGARLMAARPPRGSVVLLFQPAEETGQGARRVLDDARFAPLAPDYAFAVHNLPGFPRGQVILGRGTFASASSGLIIELEGNSSHAAEPERGQSPTLAFAHLVYSLSSGPQLFTALEAAAKVTVIHARLGEVAFGTSPGVAQVMATLRCHEQRVMDRLSERCVRLAERTAAAHDLRCSVRWTEDFPATVNDESCAAWVEAAARAAGLETSLISTPFPWSEDFGHFTGAFKGALFGLGAGPEHPALHSREYDFPDDLLAAGVDLYYQLLESVWSET